MSYGTPVALLIYNRPDLTARVLEQIARLRPKQLLVVGDGPSGTRQGDHRKVHETRAVIDRVDWNCEVLTNYADHNMGCKRRVASGLQWVFATVSEAVILEDDCVPDLSFFPFCEELLDRYRHEGRVLTISGDNFQFGRSRTEHSYYFSKYFHCWGWASWRRVWETFDVAMAHWPGFRDGGGLDQMCDSPQEREYWRRTFDACSQDQIDSWAFPWLFSCWLQGGLNVVPDVNLVSNIGFGDGASHTKSRENPLAALPACATGHLSHPQTIQRHREADLFTFDHVYWRNSASRLGRLRERLKRYVLPKALRKTA